ncbi:MAG TPA: AlpA family phage regulatory protein [Anaerolineae bacterium]|jgi:predicted site-specific integrase-resolvase
MELIDDPIRTRAWIMDRLKCSSETVRRWIKAGRLPPPDVALSQKTTGWKQSTLDAAGIKL